MACDLVRERLACFAFMSGGHADLLLVADCSEADLEGHLTDMLIVNVLQVSNLCFCSAGKYTKQESKESALIRSQATDIASWRGMARLGRTTRCSRCPILRARMRYGRATAG